MEDRYLFKAKRLDNGEWVEGNLITDEHDEKKCFIGYVFGTNDDGTPHDYDVVEVDKSTICQCTGLKDKNGKLIWENDILVGYLDDMYPENATYAQVIWDKNGFYTKEQDSDDISLMDEFDEKHFEVCGNIFDNPELLEVGE